MLTSSAPSFVVASLSLLCIDAMARSKLVRRRRGSIPWSARSVCGGAGTINFSAILRSTLTFAEFESGVPEPAIAVAKRGDDVACDCSFAGWFTCATAAADDFGANEIVVDEYRTWDNSTTPIRIEPTMRLSRASEGTEPG